MEFSGIDTLGLARVVQRGSAEILEEREDALFLRDRISGAYLLACEDVSTGILLLDRAIPRGCGLLMVTGEELGRAAFERYGFSEKLECYQVAYYGERPSLDDRLDVRIAGKGDLPMLKEHYTLISPEELEKVVERGSVLLGYHQEQLVGFIGEHLEGSMGMLYVFPEHRHRGFGAALEKHLIARTMDQGLLPFGQVVRDNVGSLRLQEKIGMTRSDRMMVWMWR